RLDRVTRRRADPLRLWGRSCDHVANITLTQAHIRADPRAVTWFTAVRTTHGYDRPDPTTRTDVRLLLQVAELRRWRPICRTARPADGTARAARRAARAACRAARAAGRRVRAACRAARATGRRVRAAGRRVRAAGRRV